MTPSRTCRRPFICYRLTFEIHKMLWNWAGYLSSLAECVGLALAFLSHYSFFFWFSFILGSLPEISELLKFSLNFILWKEKPRIPHRQLKLLSLDPTNWLILKYTSFIMVKLDSGGHAYWKSMALHLRVAQRFKLGWTAGTPHDKRNRGQ